LRARSLNRHHESNYSQPTSSSRRLLRSDDFGTRNARSRPGLAPYARAGERHVARVGSLTGRDVGCASLRDGARSSDSCPALLSLAPRRPGGVTHSLPAQGTQQNAESVLRDSQLALRYRRETAQQIGPSRHRNSRSLNHRQNLAERSVNKPENFDRPRAQQAPYLPRLRSRHIEAKFKCPVLARFKCPLLEY
jgi:hypothetical protein